MMNLVQLEYIITDTVHLPYFLPMPSPQLVNDVPTLSVVIAMDCSRDRLHAHLTKGGCTRIASITTASMLDWVCPTTGATAAEVAALPCPYSKEAQGRAYRMLDGTEERLCTLLWTSGSSGMPKAVAVGVKGFVADVSGCSESAEATSQAVTVSYIPLSHSSDRYKMWEHMVHGGRVGFAFYASSNWEAHEKDKKKGMIQYVSPIHGLFSQIRALRPGSMACPPNIWAGLYRLYTEHRAHGTARRLRAKAAMEAKDGHIDGHGGGGVGEAAAAERLDEAEEATLEQEALGKMAGMFGTPNRIKSLATGGAPTPQAHLAFATRLCALMNASMVNSYGATECGAIFANG
jgi:long-subunit acyl-CoA synthetase (AMP-forming)